MFNWKTTVKTEIDVFMCVKDLHVIIIIIVILRIISCVFILSSLLNTVAVHCHQHCTQIYLNMSLSSLTETIS